MEQYIGLDVHSTSCTAVVISPTGRKIRQTALETNPQVLIEWLRSLRRRSILVMEEGNQAEWLYELLSPFTIETLVVQPPRINGNKRDELDAERLARLARINEPGRLIFKKPQLLTALRQAAKTYVDVRRDLTRYRARLKLLLQSRGLTPAPAELLEEDLRTPWVLQLPDAMQPRASLLGARIDATKSAYDEARRWMLSEAKTVRAIRYIKSVPGIGDIRAPLIAAAMISPHRFRTKRQLWSYAGLAVVVRSSSDWKRRGGALVRRHDHELALGLNRNRNPQLKEAFIGAAQQIISRMPSHPLHLSYQQRLERGMKPIRARLTLARKIASIVLALWKRGEEYDPTKS